MITEFYQIEVYWKQKDYSSSAQDSSTGECYFPLGRVCIWTTAELWRLFCNKQFKPFIHFEVIQDNSCKSLGLAVWVFLFDKRNKYLCIYQ